MTLVVSRTDCWALDTRPPTIARPSHREVLERRQSIFLSGFSVCLSAARVWASKCLPGTSERLEDHRV